MKKLIILLLLAILIPQVTSAQIITPERILDVDYPDIPSAESPETVEATSLVEYVEYVFYFLIWGSGILALLALIMAGFQYVTASGNPDKLKDAKSKILSAFVGLAIVAGSYAIMWRINPNFVVFEVPRLDPIINNLSPGILVCKSELAPIEEIWALQTEFIISDPSRERKKQIQVSLKPLYEILSKECYYANKEGAIRPDFDNRVAVIWMIPEHSYSSHSGTVSFEEERHYGVAVFDEDDFTGIGQVFVGHFFLESFWGPLPFRPTVNVSSIQPFKRSSPNWNQSGHLPDPTIWQVKLYEEKQYNAGFADEEGNIPAPPFMEMGGMLYFFAFNNSGTGQLTPYPILNDPDTTDIELEGEPMNPKSMKINGEAIVILFKDSLDENKEAKPTIPPISDDSEKKQEGWYFEIFFESDNTLEDNYNIIKWVSCLDYESSVREEAGGEGSWGGWGGIVSRCAKPDADSIMVISGITPL